MTVGPHTRFRVERRDGKGDRKTRQDALDAEFGWDWLPRIRVVRSY